MQGKTAKKNHIRILPFFLIIALAAGSLSACGKNDSGTGSVSSVSNEDSTAAVSISESVSVSEETETPEMPATLEELDRKSTRLNSSHPTTSRMPSSA